MCRMWIDGAAPAPLESGTDQMPCENGRLRTVNSRHQTAVDMF